MGSGIRSGAAAGAAGATALNAATYLDMAIRGRPSSGTPARMVEALAGRVRLSVPGDGSTRGNRTSGLGGLSGIATGVAVGVAVALLRRAGVRPPLLAGAVLTAVTAMGTTDLSMAGLGVSDPRTWRIADWLSDLLPHLAYGVTAYATLQALDRSAG